MGSRRRRRSLHGQPQKTRGTVSATLTLDYQHNPQAAVIDANSISWGQSHGVEVGSGGTASKANVQDVTMQIPLSVNDPSVFNNIVSGSSAPTAKIVLTGKTTVMTWTLEDVVVSSYQAGGDGSGAATKTLTLNYDKIEVTSNASPGAPKLRRFTSKTGKKLRPISLTGTTVHLIPTAGSFVLATSTGQLYAIHSTDSKLAVGRLVTVSATPLLDGTYKAKKVTLGHRVKVALLKGTVTSVSTAEHSFVISAPGTSLSIARHGRTFPALQQTVTAVVQITNNGTLVQRSLKRLGRQSGPACVEGQYIGLTETRVNGKPQLELVIGSSDRSTKVPDKNTNAFPISQRQWEAMAQTLKPTSNHPKMLTLCGTGEKAKTLLNTGGLVNTWDTTKAAGSTGRTPARSSELS